MTKFFSKWGAKSGDSVIFTRTGKEDSFQISIEKGSENSVNESKAEYNKPIVLRGWSRVY